MPSLVNGGVKMLDVFTALTVLTALLALACWLYAMRVNVLRCQIFDSEKFCWFKQYEKAGSVATSRKNLLVSLQEALGMEADLSHVNEPAELADDFNNALRGREWVKHTHNETFLGRIRRVFSPSSGENTQYFSSVELRILAIVSMVKASNASQHMPHLAELSQMTRERDESRVSVQVFNCVSSVVLLLGICGTLYGIGEKLSSTGITSLSLLRSSLVPSAIAVGIAAVLRVLREIYQAQIESFYTRLDRFTMLVLVPLFQPLTDIKGESANFGRLISLIGRYDHSRTSVVLMKFLELCKSLATCEAQLRHIEEVVLVRMNYAGCAQQKMFNQLQRGAEVLTLCSSLYGRCLAMCHGVLLHYSRRYSPALREAYQLQSNMGTLTCLSTQLRKPEALVHCEVAWIRCLEAYQALQVVLSSVNQQMVRIDTGHLFEAGNRLHDSLTSDLPASCARLESSCKELIFQESIGFWDRISAAFRTQNSVLLVAQSARSAIDKSKGVVSQLRDTMRNVNARLFRSMAHLEPELKGLFDHMDEYYLREAWKKLRSGQLAAAWEYVSEWRKLGGKRRNENLLDSIIILLQIILYLLF